VASASGLVCVSTNTGSNWSGTVLTNGGNYWTACSSDGTKMFAIGSGGPILSSLDSGTTWKSTNTPLENWSGIASSGDGSNLVASISGGTIYHYPPLPVCRIVSTESNIVVSWPVQLSGYNIQQSSDLFTWATATNTVFSDPVTWQNQLLVPIQSGNAFYRLAR
jgi:hypothetical protein